MRPAMLEVLKYYFPDAKEYTPAMEQAAEIVCYAQIRMAVPGMQEGLGVFDARKLVHEIFIALSRKLPELRFPDVPVDVVKYRSEPTFFPHRPIQPIEVKDSGGEVR